MSGEPVPAGVTILWEDEDLLVVNKPAGLVVHPTYKNAGGTLLDLLRQQLPDPPAIVGRLDRWTSGLVVVARHAVAHAALQRAMAAADCEKDYLAFVHGSVMKAREIDLRIRIDENDRRRVVAARDRGSPSVTRIVPVAARDCGGFSLSMVRCRISSGRRHQIRAHLAACGWPIVGDDIYGDAALDAAIGALIPASPSRPRHALHAWRLAVTHPRSRTPLIVTAPLPRDLVPLSDYLEATDLATAS